jgi:hypothetical protein
MSDYSQNENKNSESENRNRVAENLIHGNYGTDMENTTGKSLKTKIFMMNALAFLFLLICIFSIFSFFLISTKNSDKYSVPIIIGSLIIAVAAFLVGIKLVQTLSRFNERLIPFFLFFFSFSIYLCWILMTRITPTSDYKVLYDGALSILDGTFIHDASSTSSYFYMFNFQIPYTAFMALCMKLFGRSYFTLQLIEAIIQAGVVCAFYSCIKKMSNVKPAFFSAMVFSLLSFNIVGSGIVNNQHVALLFALIGLRFMLSDTPQDGSIAGLFFSLSVLSRKSSLIFVVALLCYLVVYLFSGAGVKEKLVLVSKHIGMFLVYFLCTSMICTLLVNINIAYDSPSKDRTPYYKLLRGTVGNSLYGSSTESAIKTALYFDLESIGFDYDVYNRESKEAVLNELKTPAKLAKHSYEQMTEFVGREDNQRYFKTHFTSAVTNLSYVGYMQYLIILLLSAFFILIPNKPELSYIFIIAFIGFFLVHIFIERQSRYRYEMYVVLAMCSGFSINYLSERGRDIFNDAARRFIPKNRKTDK